MYDLVCVGNFTKDTVISAGKTRIVPGGAFNYGAHAARALGAKVCAVTHLAREDAGVVRELEALGVDVRVTYTGVSTSLRLEYPTDDPDERILTVTAVADPFSAAEVAGIEARAFVFGPSFHGEIDSEVIRTVARNPEILLAIDVQGFIRTVEGGKITYSAWDERRKILPLVSILKTDAVEATYLTGESNHLEAAKILNREGAREVLLTHRDGVVLFDGTATYEAPFLPERIVGRSGRGDTCLASYVARRLVDPPGEALLWAAALTSKKLEAEGPFGGDFAMVEQMVNERYRTAPKR